MDKSQGSCLMSNEIVTNIRSAKKVSKTSVPHELKLMAWFLQIFFRFFFYHFKLKSLISCTSFFTWTTCIKSKLFYLRILRCEVYNTRNPMWHFTWLCCPETLLVDPSSFSNNLCYDLLRINSTYTKFTSPRSQ